LTVTVAAGLALLQAVLLASGALVCFGLVALASDHNRWSQFYDGESAAAAMWMFGGLGVANVVLAVGFGVAFRQTLHQSRLWLFLCTVASTGLSMLWLASPVPIRVDWKLAYLVIPLAAVSFASHRLSNSFYRTRPDG
jgi:hypothetical protein